MVLLTNENVLLRDDDPRPVQSALEQFTASSNLPSAVAAPPDITRLRYLFPELQDDPANRLPVSPETVMALIQLGRTMAEPAPGPDSGPDIDSGIPSAYTYLGQFIDHDITLIMMPNQGDLTNPAVAPLTPAEIDRLNNARTPMLDLDSVYAEAPHVGDDLLLVGFVSPSMPSRPEGVAAGDKHDVPRTPRSRQDPKFDRVARIGDRRNDENAIISQLHVAFLRAHNAVVALGHPHCEARAILRQHYQWIVATDFLMRVADGDIVRRALAHPQEVYDPQGPRGFYMPIEFAGAAFRFGHTMVRHAYDFNSIFPPSGASLLQLFKVTGRYLTVPEKWIIQWRNFVEGGVNRARLIDTRLAEPLFSLPGQAGAASRDERRLAVRNLLRGYQLNLPTGQAVARLLERCFGLPVMTEQDILRAAATPEQAELLRTSGLAARTPLWFYILAEASHFRAGRQLGPVGSMLVAGVLIGLISGSRDSFLNVPGWEPTLPGVSDLPGLLRFAGVLT